MCGITGFNWQDQDLIGKMNASIAHRGNNDSGIFVDQKISLGHQRLSILDLSQNGHQPMMFENLTLVYNGEVYNFQEIRKELISFGYDFKSNSDTEVILKGFHKWGKDLLPKLNGMFALAIWDKNKEELFLARDAIGIKPLFFYQKDNRFIFASEIKAILQYSEIDKTLIPENISFVVKMSGFPGDKTIFRYIRQLPAAHLAILKNNRLFFEEYWKIKDFSDILDRNEIKNSIKNLLTDSVQKQMVSDVPVGVFLSGGIDSSVMTMLAGKFSNKPVKTFSVGFEVKQEHDFKYNADFYLARKTAKHFGTDHHELFLKRGQALEYMNQMAKNMEMPNSMSTAVPSFWLSEHAKREVSVVLGGDGGDELFGGYERYQLSLMVSKWLKLPKTLRNIFPAKIAEKILQKKDLADRLRMDSKLDRYLSFKLHRDGDAQVLFKNNIFSSEIVDKYIEDNFFTNPLPTDDFEKYFMHVDLKTWLVDHSLLRTDKTTMQFALEERVPILDHRLVELAIKIPTKYKVDFRNTKKIFKDTFRDDLPSFLFNQPKRGWVSPAAKWLREELKDFAYDVLADNFAPGTEEFYDLKIARKMLDEHISTEKYNLHLLWIVISFQLWHKEFIS